jgi:hypothetical protein
MGSPQTDTNIYVLTGSDTMSINGATLIGQADDNWGDLKFPNPIANMKTGKNGNTLFGFNATGKNCEQTLRLLRGSSDDQILNGLLQQQLYNFASFVLLYGQFIKKLGDGAGNVLSDIINLGGGVIEKQPEAASNTSGDTNQSVVIYMIKWARASRSIG